MTRDPAATIRELKEQSGKDIWLWGSLKLMHSLLDAGVVDVVQMLVCPVSRGKGMRIFEDRQDLKLVRKRRGTSALRDQEICGRSALSKNRTPSQTAAIPPRPHLPHCPGKPGLHVCAATPDVKETAW
ncbi:dihydrofolate reductase family protein [Nonomuraea sp. NPDC049141]|uniref:dihydrofolate reductase family protein n=1 Tax=Nonomuraea sp. NPDC049141 TaxID=3155500 RepID=UPI0033DF224C